MSSVILALVLGTLLITVGIIATIGFRSSQDAMRELNTQHYFLAITEIRDQTVRILETILLVAGEYEAMLRRDLIPENNTQVLGLIFAERLRQEKDVDEISYTRLPAGDYVSANRSIPTAVIIRHALPGFPRRQTSAIISPEGKETVYADPYWQRPYDPRSRSWFQDILNGNGKLVWTVFQAFGRPFYCLGVGFLLFDERQNSKKKSLKGIFIVDSSEEKLRERLSHLLSTHQRLLFVLASDYLLLAQHSTIPNVSVDLLREDALHVISHTKPVSSKETFEITSMDFDGRNFEVAFAEIHLEGGMRCKVGLVIPEEEFFKLAKSNLRSTLFYGLYALLIASALSIWVSKRLARPLRQLTATLEHMAAFDIPSGRSPRSHVRETAIVSDAVDRLKRALQSFGRYVPVGVVRELIATHRDAGREGKEYFITILFSELEMRRSNKNIPESLRLLQEYFTIGTQLVEREGSVDKYFGGGGLMALFNEPHPVLDHAGAACLTALRWCEEWRRTLKGTEISTHHQVRFGINTGTALVGNIGTKNRLAYTAMGDTVNLAHRLMDLAFSLDLCILVGEETRIQVATSFEWRFLGHHQVPGRTNRILVWELLGQKNSVPMNLLEARDEFEKGLAEWNYGDWTKARTRFSHALKLRPSDRLTVSYLTKFKI